MLRAMRRARNAASRAVALAAALVLPLWAAPAAAALDGAQPYPGYVSEVYSDPASWLCRPDMDDVCDRELDATAVYASGRTRVERFRPAAAPRIDCFYVYPTISTDESGNSDLEPGDDQELFVVRQQAARLGEACRLFAPVYRQVTLTGLLSLLGGTPIPTDSQLAYQDVLDAWKHYVANDSEGRGVVLIGHSQGASHLTRLVREEIDPNPVLRDRLVSAMLLGTSVQVAGGRDVGGDFANVPLCRRPYQTGCVISYATFRATSPPPENSRFGVSRGPGLHAACTNPAALGGGRGTLHPYLGTNGQSLPIYPLPDPPPAWLDPALGVSIETPFVTAPGLFEAECAEHNGFHYLAITINGDPDDPRFDDLTGADITPDWGLHLVDVSLALGDLVDVAKRQARAYCARQRRCPPAPLSRR